MSIANEITRIQNAKVAIKTAIENKGGSVGATIDTYATAIDNLPSGGGASDYFVSTINTTQMQKAIKRLPPLILQYNGRFTNSFQGSLALEQVDLLQMTGITDITDLFANCYNLQSINLITSSKLTSAVRTFSSCKKLETIPLFDTSGVTNFYYFCSDCSNLKNVPQLDFTSATNLQSMFAMCKQLTDESLNNILMSCIGATSYTGTKTLDYLGLYGLIYRDRVPNLSNYQAFLDAGWKTGW